MKGGTSMLGVLERLWVGWLRLRSPAPPPPSRVWMVVSEEAAIAAARHFNDANGHDPWEEWSIKVRPEMIEGRLTWVVRVYCVLWPEEEQWMQVSDTMEYFVDGTTGEFFGFATERSRTIFQRAPMR